MTMRRYDEAEITRFLVALDARLDAPVQLVIIGGTALALGYGVSAATIDIDTYGCDLTAVQQAASLARVQTGLDITIDNSVIAQLPAGYRERLRPVLPALGCLQLWVLDPYDLAASKLLRGSIHDRQQLQQLHERAPLDRDLLVARFKDLLDDYVGDPTEPRWSLFHFVAEVWGELDALDLRP
jgi:hypothetical protein